MKVMEKDKLDTEDEGNGKEADRKRVSGGTGVVRKEVNK